MTKLVPSHCISHSFFLFFLSFHILNHISIIFTTLGLFTFNPPSIMELKKPPPTSSPLLHFFINHLCFPYILFSLFFLSSSSQSCFCFIKRAFFEVAKHVRHTSLQVGLKPLTTSATGTLTSFETRRTKPSTSTCCGTRSMPTRRTWNTCSRLISRTSPRRKTFQPSSEIFLAKESSTSMSTHGDSRRRWRACTSTTTPW